MRTRSGDENQIYDNIAESNLGTRMRYNCRRPEHKRSFLRRALAFVLSGGIRFFLFSKN